MKINRLKGLFLNSVMVAALSFVVACQASSSDIEKGLQSFLDKNPQFLQKKIQDAMKANPVAKSQPEVPLEDQIKNAIPVDLNNAPTMGPATAPITIVEFSDFQCPFCKRAAPTMEQLVKEYNGKVRVAFRFHPLPFHKNAMPAAKAALAANKQGKFWQMHDALFEGQADLSEEGILKIAKNLKLNMAKFEKDWKSTEFDKQIQADIDFATKNGANGTPAFYVNGVYIKGAKPIDSFRQVISKLLETKAPIAPAAAPPTQPTPPQG